MGSKSATYGPVAMKAIKFGVSSSFVAAGAYVLAKPTFAEERKIPYWGLPGTQNERTFIAVKPGSKNASLKV